MDSLISKDRIRLSIRPVLSTLVLLLMLTACTGGVRDSAPANYTKQWDEIPDAVPVAVKTSKYGNPDNYTVMGKTYYVKDSSDGFKQKGIASWYGSKFHGRRTSSGEEYSMYSMTAAHKTLPIPVYVEVTNIDNGRTAIVRVNDRGPFHEGRIIDLSYAAATKLGVAQTGTANVKIRVVTPETGKKRQGGDVSAKSSYSESDKLYVQVAAFSTEKNARQHLEKLQDEGFFDVLPTEHVAKNVLAQLKEKNHKNLKIVKNN
jgi:rare lipoprotein A